MNWTTEARELVDGVLDKVPAMIRGMAIDAANLASEAKADERGSQTIEVEDAVRGLIKAAPFHMRKRLKEEIQARGIDADRYL